MKKILSILYPFFFAVYPILELRNYNIAYVDTASIFRPILISVVLTGLIWLLLRVFIKDWQKSAIITTLIMIALLTYGHVYIQIESALGEPLRHRYLLLIFAVVLLGLSGWIIWKVKNLKPLTDFLVTVGGVLLLFAAGQALLHDISVFQETRNARKGEASVIEPANNGIQKPDIYFILLDAHTRTDILQQDFHYDNSAFIQNLKDQGFYVAECAQSNYPATKLSVSATFYGKYLDERYLAPVNSSLTIETLRGLGYKVITFENRSNGHFDIQEDLRLSRNQMALGRIDMTGGLSEFDMMLVRTSFFRVFFDMPQLVPGLDPQMLQKTEYYEHYQQTHYILDELKRLPDMQGPKFVFAHILVPHPPFIFSPDGKFNWAEDPRKGYVSNVQFIDSQIAQVTAEILKKSKIPPVIVIMGDHGPAGTPNITPHMRMSILNAYYVNDGARQDLYETITPVNSFRVIFNNYFGTNYPLLEDKSYYSYGMGNFTDQTLVKNTCQVEP